VKVAVVFPWRAGCPWRERARQWVQSRYTELHPEWVQVLGSCNPDQPFNRAEAILDGARRVDADVYVVADADVWCPKVGRSIAPALERGWATPQKKLHRLTDAASERLMAGETDGLRTIEIYTGHHAGTLVVLRTDVLFDVPPDVRFVGWGQEDDAWRIALTELVAQPHRTGGGSDLFHLWHPPQERLNRIEGNPDGVALLRRYKQARALGAPALRHLLDESRALWPQPA